MNGTDTAKTLGRAGRIHSAMRDIGAIIAVAIALFVLSFVSEDE
jgi:hypothetical protein